MKVCIFIIFILSFNGSGYCQDNNINSLIETIKKQANKANCVPVIDNVSEIPALIAADSIARITNDTFTRAVINEQLGFFYHSRNADQSIHYFNLAIEFYFAINNRRRATLCMQNIAFVYDENKNNTGVAIDFVTKAIAERIELKDTMEMANMYKYLGELEGK